MLQLVYTSVPTVEWDGDLEAIRMQAASNNATHEITGILLVREGFFLQVLEGPQSAVEDAFIRIIKDPRHESLKLLHRRKLTRREFGENPMVKLTDDRAERAAIVAVCEIMANAEASARIVYNQRFGDVASASTGHCGQENQSSASAMP